VNRKENVSDGTVSWTRIRYYTRESPSRIPRKFSKKLASLPRGGIVYLERKFPQRTSPETRHRALSVASTSALIRDTQDATPKTSNYLTSRPLSDTVSELVIGYGNAKQASQVSWLDMYTVIL
ncbi:hypothetical protein V1478_002901, partial [Vespula squamosa]